MELDDKLIPKDVREQCDCAIRILEQDNADMEIIEKSLENFITDDELSSQAYDALKTQLNDYLTILSTMKAANDLDIEDLNTLKSAVGDEELWGNIIKAGKDQAVLDMDTFLDRADTFMQKARSVSVTTPLGTWYLQTAGYYEMRAIFAEKKYDKWIEKEQRFDEINGMTQHLFTRSTPLREAAKQGMESITGVFQNGAYHIDRNASWRSSLALEKQNLLQSITTQFMTTNTAGESDYNWSYIEEWMKQDVEEVSELEYLAFVDLMSDMSGAELQMLFSKAQINASPFDNSCCDVSEVMKKAAEQYLIITEIEAEFTIFNTHSTYDYDEITITNELGRAILVSQIVAGMTRSGAGKRHYVDISMTEDSKGRMTYVAELTVSPGYSGQMGDNLAAEAQGRTITVNPWGTPAMAENDLEDTVEVTLLSLKPSAAESICKSGGDTAAGYIFSEIGKKTAEEIGSSLSYSLTTVELIAELKKGYEDSVEIDGAVDSLHMGQAVEALGIHTGIVKVQGSTENSSIFICPKYDPEELLVRVAAYNCENEPPITVEELRQGFESNGEIFTTYMDWYYEGGDGEIEEYWVKLEKIGKVYSNSVKEMSITQLQELINKFNDPTYEINTEIMGEQE